MQHSIRPVRAGDAAAVAAIYAPYVLETPISFELSPPDEREIAARIASRTKTHPWLVAEEPSGRVVGYTYAGPFRDRPAYRYSAESAVYVERGAHRRGLGRALMSELLDRLRSQGVHTVIAGVTLPNAGSVGLHEALGFRPVGAFREVGWKFGAWHDVAFWQLRLADGPPAP
jgi:phosphinothricin acetyltransferase